MGSGIKLTWYEIAYDGNSEETTKSKVEKQLKTQSAKDALNDDRAVYVIRSNPPFAFSYPLQPSPVIYIGKGKFWNRLSQSHSKRIEILHKRIGLTFSIQFCSPRRKKN